ncbi:unnamed protein product [Toxocara canis]|uniref:Secreted protein n=1 Tax=Toxocara canis TaxID=6265 RepID=A0A183V1D5_TOXCA|nr:unnamed protein product [Toxocara canis]
MMYLCPRVSPAPAWGSIEASLGPLHPSLILSCEVADKLTFGSVKKEQIATIWRAVCCISLLRTVTFGAANDHMSR